MKITRVETIPIRVPIKPALAIKSGRGGSHMTSPFLLVKIHTDEGHVGLGEVSCTPRWSGEDQFTARHFIEEYFAPLLVGEDPSDIEKLNAKFAAPVAGNQFTKSGVEMALWDLVGKSRGVPVHQVLGARLRDFVPTKWSVSGVDPEKAAEIGRWALAQGFTAMKVKVGIDPEGDVARLRAVREAVGPKVHLGVDANGGWVTADVAVPMISRLRDFDIDFVEQPVAQRDTRGMAQVRSACGIPVIADESVYTLYDARALAQANACDVFSIYIGKAGGIGPARAIAKFAHEHGIACTIGSNLELGVGSAAMIHVALATPGIAPDRYPCDVIGPLFYEDDILRDPLPIVGGSARPHDKPGLGVELNDEKVERYRMR
jgi:muconate cycloisomerase